MNELDWNWFFSSVAQSCAAIVGIFGAFIITKIVNNQSEYNRKTIVIDQLHDEIKTLKINTYDKYLPRFISHETNNLFNTIKECSPKDSIIETFSSPLFSFLSEKDKSAISDDIITRKDKNEFNQYWLKDRLMPSLHKFPELDPLSQNYQLIYSNINNYIEKILNCIKEIKSIVPTTENNPESSKLISRSLLLAEFLLLVGVIYPLHFLPVVVGKTPVLTLSSNAIIHIIFSLKGAILGSVFLSYTAISAFFYYANSIMKYDQQKIQFLKAHTQLHNYSKHLLQALEKPKQQ